MKQSDVHVTLTVIAGEDSGKSVRMEECKVVIGRKNADLPLRDKKVSSQHASIEVEGNRVSIVDLNSRNGILVNGKSVKQSDLNNLDEIELGITKIKVLIVDNLQRFKEKNISSSAETIQVNGDIGSLIDDELSRFSRWDLSRPSDVTIEGSSESQVCFGLQVIQGPDAGKTIRVEKEKTSLGRGNADVAFHDADISRLHASIEILPNNQAIIRDLKSTNGTQVNSKKIEEIELSPNDEIQIGSTVIRFIKDA